MLLTILRINEGNIRAKIKQFFLILAQGSIEYLIL